MSRRTELFDYDEREPQAPIRPLGEFSTYVVDTLPEQAESLRTFVQKGVPHQDQIVGTEQYSDRVASIPSGLKGEVKREMAARFDGVTPAMLADAITDPHTRDIALLDMMMADTVAAHYGITVPSALDGTLRVFAQEAHHPPFMTYEDVILVNPLTEDPRTFTRGQIGSAERDFYMAHRRIEGELAPATEGLGTAAQLLRDQGNQGVDEAATLIQGFDSAVEFSQRYLAGLRFDMKREHFNTFRAPYFNAHPLRNPAMEDGGVNKFGRRGFGPSGRFTGTFPLADIWFMGDTLSDFKKDDFQNILQEGYYPRFQMAQIAEAFKTSANGNSIVELTKALGNPDVLFDTANAAIKRINGFRSQHVHTVVQQIPQVAAGEAGGSATKKGETIQYLEDHMLPPLNK